MRTRTFPLTARARRYLRLLCQRTLLWTLMAISARPVLAETAQNSPVPESELGLLVDFEVREHLLKNSKLAIVALDEQGIPQEHIQGTYTFQINGFKQELRFMDGIGVAPQPVESSFFVFIKHKNMRGSVGKLYYILKKDQDLRPIHIQWYFLILVPFLILLLAYAFKRLLVFAILVLVGMFVFNYYKGLNLENLFDTLVHGIKALGGG